MGAIVCTVRNFLDTIIDIVGIKSGILLSRMTVIDILKGRDPDFDLLEEEFDQDIRIRSETYEDHIRYVRIKIGNLKPEMQHPFLWADRLVELDREGHQAFSVLLFLNLLANIRGKRLTLTISHSGNAPWYAVRTRYWGNTNMGRPSTAKSSYIPAGRRRMGRRYPTGTVV